MDLAKKALGPILGLGVSLLAGKKSKSSVTALPQATRDDAAAQTAANDELLRRKGGAADILTSIRGAEAPTGGLKTLLG